MCIRSLKQYNLQLITYINILTTVFQNIARLKAQKAAATDKKKGTTSTGAGAKSATAVVGHGPKVLSAKDPVLTEEERSLRRYGHGVNVCAIGPRNKVRDPLWVEHHGGLPSSSTSGVEAASASAQDSNNSTNKSSSGTGGDATSAADDGIRTVTNPFSFGFF